MPVMPLHLGPGILLKVFAGSQLSLVMFALTQVTMDLEVLLRFALGSARLHGFTNTIIGATVALLVTVPFGKPVCEWILRWWNRQLSQAQAKWVGVSEKITWRAAWIGGVLGVYSHFLLDAIMHSDAKPWMPFSNANSLVYLISIGQLNLLCLLSVVMGVFLIGGFRLLRSRRPVMHSSERSWARSSEFAHLEELDANTIKLWGGLERAIQ